MKVSTSEKKTEAIERMKILKISPDVIRQFEEHERIFVSEPPMGLPRQADGGDLEHIREFEENYDAMVYAVIRSYTVFGKMDSYLYVSDHREEWVDDREDAAMASGGIYAYAYNHDAPDCSEIGSIGIEHTPTGGLQRIW